MKQRHNRLASYIFPHYWFSACRYDSKCISTQMKKVFYLYFIGHKSHVSSLAPARLRFLSAVLKAGEDQSAARSPRIQAANPAYKYQSFKTNGKFKSLCHLLSVLSPPPKFIVTHLIFNIICREPDFFSEICIKRVKGSDEKT